MLSRHFEQDKVTMLNAAYDILDSMNGQLLQIDSESGSILFRINYGNPIRMRIHTLYPSGKTEISIEQLSDDKDSKMDSQLPEVLFDEMTSIIQRIVDE